MLDIVVVKHLGTFERLVEEDLVEAIVLQDIHIHRLVQTEVCHSSQAGRSAPIT